MPRYTLKDENRKPTPNGVSYWTFRNNHKGVIRALIHYHNYEFSGGKGYPASPKIALAIENLGLGVIVKETKYILYIVLNSHGVRYMNYLLEDLTLDNIG